jgi:hypothetical protein
MKVQLSLNICRIYCRRSEAGKMEDKQEQQEQQEQPDKEE